jgi:hypothetical protein
MIFMFCGCYMGSNHQKCPHAVPSNAFSKQNSKEMGKIRDLDYEFQQRFVHSEAESEYFLLWVQIK